jgi:hypothetical protein
MESGALIWAVRPTWAAQMLPAIVGATLAFDVSGARPKAGDRHAH